jgi:hypothetical protein
MRMNSLQQGQELPGVRDRKRDANKMTNSAMQLQANQSPVNE